MAFRSGANYPSRRGNPCPKRSLTKAAFARSAGRARTVPGKRLHDRRGLAAGLSLADEALLGLASRLQQALSRLARAAGSGRRTFCRRWRWRGATPNCRSSSNASANTGAREGLAHPGGTGRFPRRRGTLLEGASGRLLSTARAALARRAQHIEQSLSADQSTLFPLAGAGGRHLPGPAPCRRTGPSRNARRAASTGSRCWIGRRPRYRGAERAQTRGRPQSALAEVAGETPPDGPLHAQAEQLLAMLAADLQAARAGCANRSGRTRGPRLLWTVAQKDQPPYRLDDRALTFVTGQAPHVALTDQRSAPRPPARDAGQRGRLRSRLEPVLRTLIPNQEPRGSIPAAAPAAGCPGAGMRGSSTGAGPRGTAITRTGPGRLASRVSPLPVRVMAVPRGPAPVELPRMPAPGQPAAGAAAGNTPARVLVGDQSAQVRLEQLEADRADQHHAPVAAGRCAGRSGRHARPGRFRRSAPGHPGGCGG